VYADFAELFRRLFGLDIPGLSLLKTFGFMMAMSFFAAGYTLFLEFVRKEKQGYLQGVIVNVKYGEKVSIISYIINGFIGGLIGYKVLGMMQNLAEASADPMNFLTNTKGSILGAFIGIGLGVFMKYQSAKEFANGGVVETKKQLLRPFMRVGDIAIIAALFGFLGAKIFNAFESWDDFIQDPIRNLISSSGLTFYGGLIMATAALYIASIKWKISFKQMCDATAPGLILAYGIGRLGCQVSGDGDWGICNSAYVTTIDGKAVPAQDSNAFEMAKVQYKSYFDSHYSQFATVPAIHAPRPKMLSFLPHSFFAYSYSYNVNNVGIPLAGCKGNYCNTLPSPVFPTPLYEFLMCFIIFIVLWKLRKVMSKPLDLFAVYLIFNGVERYAIEQVRVNFKYNFGFWHPTQAELIALGLILIGILMFVINRFVKHNGPPFAPSSIAVN
jgi:phosphatidylglycerol---prolipoprotein diacylglyceryl transferase